MTRMSEMTQGSKLQFSPTLILLFVGLACFIATCFYGFSTAFWIDEMQQLQMVRNGPLLWLQGHHNAGMLATDLLQWVVTFIVADNLYVLRSVSLLLVLVVFPLALIPFYQRTPLPALLAGAMIFGTFIIGYQATEAKSYSLFLGMGLINYSWAMGRIHGRMVKLFLCLSPVLIHWLAVFPLSAAVFIRRKRSDLPLLALGAFLTLLECTVFWQHGFLSLTQVKSDGEPVVVAELYGIFQWLFGPDGAGLGITFAVLTLFLTMRPQTRRNFLPFVFVFFAQIGLHITLNGTIPIRYILWFVPLFVVQAMQSIWEIKRGPTVAIVVAAAWLAIQIPIHAQFSQRPERYGPWFDYKSASIFLDKIEAKHVYLDLPNTFLDNWIASVPEISGKNRTFYVHPRALVDCNWHHYSFCDQLKIYNLEQIKKARAGWAPSSFATIHYLGAVRPLNGLFPWWVARHKEHESVATTFKNPNWFEGMAVVSLFANGITRPTHQPMN